MRRFTTLFAVAVLAMGSLVACGDDDDTTTAAPGDSAEENGDDRDPRAAEFCRLSLELDEGDGPPTPEQFEALRDTAPAEIQDDVDVAVERILEVGLMQAFGDPEVGAAFERIEAWEEENCPERAERDEDPEPVAQDPDPDATVVNVTATDYAFEIEGDVPGGLVAFVLQNDGDEPHHLDVVRFKDEFSEEEVRQALEEGSDELFGMVDEDTDLADQTTSTDATPGEQAVLNVDLPAGLYGLACFVPTPEGTPHFFHGMWELFTVE